MGSIFKPKMPSPPPMVAPPPPPSEVDYEDEARKAEAAEEERRANLKRKGRRSTILTGTGLTEIAEENIEKKKLGG